MSRKVPFVTLEKVREIAGVFPTPFHLYDEQGIRRTAQGVNTAFAWNAGYREYYAVKACPNPAILKILQEYGCGVDCSSLSELLMAHACGFQGEQIMFSSNETPDEEYILANSLGAIINLDDITHIAQLQRLLPEFPKTMSCRFNPGGQFQVRNDIMGTPSEAKYGMTEAQIFEAFDQLERLGVENFGLHAFLASNTLSNEYYAKNAEVLCELAVKLQHTGYNITFINLSGGVGIPYRPEQEPNDIQRIGAKVEAVWRNILEEHGIRNIALYTEMGRFMTGPHGCLVTKAIHEKNTHKKYIGVDACAADLMRPAMYGAYHHITVLGKEACPAKESVRDLVLGEEPKMEFYDIVGSLCENNDKFAIDRKLPQIDIGDYLVIHDTGAHGRAMGYNYNGKLRSGEVLLHPDGTFTVIRRKETIRDLFATLNIVSCPEIRQLWERRWRSNNPRIKGFADM